MHELAITESAFRIALTTAQAHGARRLTVIRLILGEMTQVDPACVEFYLAVLAKGTMAEGLRVECERVPLRARCRVCGTEFGPAGLDFSCPRCRSAEVEVLSGRELQVSSIEID